MAQTVVVTGANRGIGLEFCRQFRDRGDRVVAVCRTSTDELDALEIETIADVELTASGAVRLLDQRLGDARIDVLIQNAGIMHDDRLGCLDANQMLEQMQVNAIAPLLATEQLLWRMNPGGKIAFITSRMGSIADNSSGGRYGYRASKAALNAFAKSLAIDLEPRRISVGILHPGFVKTRMVNFGGIISPEESVQGLVRLIDALHPGTSGTFWHTNGDVLPW